MSTSNWIGKEEDPEINIPPFDIDNTVRLIRWMIVGEPLASGSDSKFECLRHSQLLRRHITSIMLTYFVNYSGDNSN
jgi:hypothetical protein